MRLNKRLLHSHEMMEHFDPRRVYFSASEERNMILSKRDGAFFDLLWDYIAPTGNIYRYNCFSAERRKHCEDIMLQMKEIADEYAPLLGGKGEGQEERVQHLCDVLHHTKVVLPQATQADQEKGSDITKGFQPIEDFLDKVTRYGPVLLADCPLERRFQLKTVGLALIIVTIQVLAPLLVIVTTWRKDRNPLGDIGWLRRHLTWHQALCLGNDFWHVLTTFLGLAFMTVLIFIVRIYVNSEAKHAVKASRLPADKFWTMTGVLVNSWCCSLTVVAIPLLLWSEDALVNIVLDTMTLLFIFRLDDLSEHLSGFLRMQDEDFQRMLCWHAGLLAQCPVHLKDLINPSADDKKDLWNIHFDSAGQLLAADPTMPGQLCDTRFMMAPVDETQPLMHKPKFSPTPYTSGADSRRPSINSTVKMYFGMKMHEQRGLIYCTSRTQVMVLPSTFPGVLACALCDGVSWFLMACQFIIPVVWLGLNMPCLDRSQAH